MHIDGNGNLVDAEGKIIKTKEELEAVVKTDVNALVQAKVEEGLKEIKSKLDGAYSQRDEALRKAAEKEAAEREAEKKRLEAEGKHKELADMRVAEERARREAAEAKVTALTRDGVVRQVLSDLEFRNARANDIAFKEIIADLHQNAEGNWVSKSTGLDIPSYVKKFSEDPEQAFLFKTKENNGGGGNGGGQNNGGGGGTPTKLTKSVFAYTQAELLEMAEKGQLTR